jgi:membrane protein DedA with SNARE-associated domain
MMDSLFSFVVVPHETLSYWLLAYGSVVIFCLLALGILLLPIPDETLIMLTGILIAQKQLMWAPALLACYAGALCGISVSFFIGTLAGGYLIKSYENWLSFTEIKREQMHHWFRRFGKWVLFFGYFIPGIRHFAGLMAGLSKLEFLQFALFAYSGAVCWVSTFLSIGYFLGDYGMQVLEYVESRMEFFTLVIVFLVVCYFVVKYIFQGK